MRISPLPILAVIASLFITGCRDPKIRSYRIAKETITQSPPGMVPAATTTPAVHWQKPDGWEEQPGKSMRVGSFLVTGSEGRKAELAVTTFAGDVGGDFANVNRWRGQIQLPPITEAELPAAITSLNLPAGHFQLVDLVSTDALLDGKYKARILGAWLKQPERTWFFKLAGENDLVGAQRETFLAFLRTVEFPPAGVPAEPAANTNNLPVPAPITTKSISAGPAPDAGLSWTAPSTWTPKPLGRMRRGSYSINSVNGTEVDLSITMFAAASNPLLENINRWRRQLSLTPIAEAQVNETTTAIANGDLKFTVVDLPGTSVTDGSPSRTIGAILYFGDEAWFFKLSGPDAAVAAQKTAFLDFLKTVNAR